MFSDSQGTVVDFRQDEIAKGIGVEKIRFRNIGREKLEGFALKASNAVARFGGELGI